MDARYEPPEQAQLNQMIDQLNQFVCDNLDIITADDILLEHLKRIVMDIYTYSSLAQPILDLLCKKNLLSIDRVPLPHLQDETFSVSGLGKKDLTLIQKEIEYLLTHGQHLI